jgi:hypothetical protein
MTIINNFKPQRARFPADGHPQGKKKNAPAPGIQTLAKLHMKLE